MTRQNLVGHVLVIIATVSGVVGMGLMYDAISRGDVLGMSRAAPFLLLGLWWAGRELGSSMMVSKRRRQATNLTVTSDACRE